MKVKADGLEIERDPVDAVVAYSWNRVPGATSYTVTVRENADGTQVLDVIAVAATVAPTSACGSV